MQCVDVGQAVSKQQCKGVWVELSFFLLTDLFSDIEKLWTLGDDTLSCVRHNIKVWLKCGAAASRSDCWLADKNVG